MNIHINEQAFSVFSRMLGSKKDKDMLTDHWVQCILEACESGRYPRREALEKECIEGSDAFSCFVDHLLGNGDVEAKLLQPILERMHVGTISISEFMSELSWAEAVIEDRLRSEGVNKDEQDEGVRRVRSVCRSISKAVLESGADIYQFAVARGGSAFCHIDTDGRIVFSNYEMKKLTGRDQIEGESFAALFGGIDRDLVNTMVAACKGRQEPQLGPMCIVNEPGERIPVGLEIAPVVAYERFRGCYARMVNISEPRKMMNRIFDQSPLGIVRVNSEWKFDYANVAACRSVGCSSLEGVEVRRLFPTPENWAAVEKQLRIRFETGEEGEYEARITRLDNGRLVPIKIASTPERDLKGKTVIGTMAIMRDLTQEKTATAVLEHAEECTTVRELMEKIKDEISDVLPLDGMTFSIMSSDLKHIRTPYMYFKDGPIEKLVRWWRPTEHVKDWMINKENRIIDDLEQLLEQPHWQELRSDSGIQALLQRRLFSIHRVPVYKEGTLCASFSLYRKGKKAFSPQEAAFIEGLFLDRAGVIALYLEERRDLTFRLKLLNDLIFRCHDLPNLAKTLAEQLVEHYDWEIVTIFMIDERQRVYRLLSHKIKQEVSGFAIEKDYQQPFNTGFLGRVHKTGVGINADNVRQEPYIRWYYAKHSQTVSELCEPLHLNGIRWILNVEDKDESAFSVNEVEGLRKLLDELSHLLGLAIQHYILEGTFNSVSDAIIVVDSMGQIVHLNPEARSLLGIQLNLEEGSLLGTDRENPVDRSLAPFLSDRSDLDWILRNRELRNEERQLITSAGESIEGLLSAYQLPKELGGTVFVFKDIRHLKKLKELSDLRDAFYRVAAETNPPLSLASTWLKRAKELFDPQETKSLIEKSLKQLNRVRISFDRLALCNRDGTGPSQDRILLDVRKLIRDMVQELPAFEADKVELSCRDQAHWVRADHYQLSFCFETILSCLLRVVPEDDMIQIRTDVSRPFILIEVSGFRPELSEAQPDLAGRSRALADVGIYEDLIRRFIENHCGRYQRLWGNSGRMVFRIELPLEEEGHCHV